ncbi:MAG: hypothetical protein R3C11_08695 [Planctomycetaceae bacterium]
MVHRPHLLRVVISPGWGSTYLDLASYLANSSIVEGLVLPAMWAVNRLTLRTLRRLSL